MRPATRTAESRTLTAEVHADLRRRVLHGELPSGTRLHLGQLASECGVSLGVVREAVTRLAGERLLEAIPQSGFRVRELSAAHLADLAWARTHIESLAVHASVEHGDTEWEAALLGAHHVLSVTPPFNDEGSVNAAWMNAHRRFHAELASACPSSTMLDARQRLFDEAELYRHWSARGVGAKRDIAAEHDGLLGAALRRDADGAASLVRAHIKLTADLAGYR
jgi:GntR family transcriptional regulator, carbon starvation induced regulator